MGQQSTEIVRQAIAANRSDLEQEEFERRVLQLWHPEVEFNSRVAAVEGSAYHGHPGLRQYMADLREAFVEWHNEIMEITEIGPDAVMIENVFSGVAHSGVPVELRSAILAISADDKIFRVFSYATADEALAAAGIAGQPPE